MSLDRNKENEKKDYKFKKFGSDMEYSINDSTFEIFHKLIRNYLIISYVLLEKLDLYYGQPQILMALNKTDGQSQNELAKQRCVKASTNTVMLNRMEKVGLITKKKDKKDQRITRIYLTAKGKEICKQIEKLGIDMEEMLFKNFSKEEKIIMKRLSMQLIDNINSYKKDNKIK